jgi:hypothetical protein
VCGTWNETKRLTAAEVLAAVAFVGRWELRIAGWRGTARVEGGAWLVE